MILARVFSKIYKEAELFLLTQKVKNIFAVTQEEINLSLLNY